MRKSQEFAARRVLHIVERVAIAVIIKQSSATQQVTLVLANAVIRT